MRHLRTIITSSYVLVDFVLLGILFFLPYFLYYNHSLPSDFKIHMLIYAFWILSTALLFHGSQLYFTVRELTIWREAGRAVRAFVFSTLLSILLLFLLKVQTERILTA